jgi:ABC-type phosphonate transport system ATPase subunit
MSDALAVIVTEGLTKFYGKHRGIEEVTFAVSRGEVHRRDVGA